MTNKGFVFSIISIIVLIAIAGLVAGHRENPGYSLSEFALQQKMHDFLIVTQGREIRGTEMQIECQKVFGKKCAGVFFGDLNAEIPNTRAESIYWLDELLVFEKISVLVYD